MSDDQCPATTQTGFGVVRCQMPPGHPEHHTNQSYRWYGGYPDSHTPPVPACTDTIWVSDEIGTVTCSRGQGHRGDHAESTTGRELRWPLVGPVPVPETVTNEPTRHYGSNDLAGVNRDDLIHNLFKRVEQLEQSSADGAATDDMFKTASRAVERLASGLDEIERRMTALERRASPTRADQLMNTQFERLNGAICQVNGDAQQRNQAMVDRLKAMWDVLAAMAPIIDSLKPALLKVICGAPDGSGEIVCGRDQGHDGRHMANGFSWPAKPVPDQAEHASGSPVQCPTQFREGQCLGYAGHDGECSAVDGSGNPQMEGHEEFSGDDYPEQNFHS